MVDNQIEKEQLDSLADKLKEEAEKEELPKMKVSGRSVFEIQKIKKNRADKEQK